MAEMTSTILPRRTYCTVYKKEIRLTERFADSVNVSDWLGYCRFFAAKQPNGIFNCTNCRRTMELYTCSGKGCTSSGKGCTPGGAEGK